MKTGSFSNFVSKSPEWLVQQKPDKNDKHDQE